MKYFKKNTEVWAFEEDGSQDHLITAEFIQMTAEEIDAHINPPIPEPEPIPPAPLVVSRFQALAALMQAGLLEQVEAYMALETTDPFTRLAWKEAQEFREDSPMLANLATLLGLTSEQVSELFQIAKTITA